MSLLCKGLENRLGAIHAGMAGVDREHVKKVVYEMSKVCQLGELWSVAFAYVIWQPLSGGPAPGLTSFQERAEEAKAD